MLVNVATVPKLDIILEDVTRPDYYQRHLALSAFPGELVCISLQNQMIRQTGTSTHCLQLLFSRLHIFSIDCIFFLKRIVVGLHFFVSRYCSSSGSSSLASVHHLSCVFSEPLRSHRLLVRTFPIYKQRYICAIVVRGWRRWAILVQIHGHAVSELTTEQREPLWELKCFLPSEFRICFRIDIRGGTWFLDVIAVKKAEISSTAKFSLCSLRLRLIKAVTMETHHVFYESNASGLSSLSAQDIRLSNTG